MGVETKKENLKPIEFWAIVGAVTVAVIIVATFAISIAMKDDGNKSDEIASASLAPSETIDEDIHVSPPQYRPIPQAFTRREISRR